MSLPTYLKSLPAIASSGEAGGEERIARKIVDAAYAVHKTLGPGLLERVYPVWEAQLLSHLKLTSKRLGFLINFNVHLIKSAST
jgi:hypothetical protein